MSVGVAVKCPLFLSQFNETWIFKANFSKNIQYTNFMKIRLVGADLFHADGRSDGQTYIHDGAKSGFSQFGERT
jgi:hypothetical protein